LNAAAQNDFADKTVYSLYRAIFITGMLCKYFKFEESAEDSASQPTLPSIYDLLIFWATLLVGEKAEPIKTAAIAALGSLFTTHPKYVLQQPSVSVLDAVLKPKSNLATMPSVDMQHQVLQLLLDFLMADEERMQKRVGQKANVDTTTHKSTADLDALKGYSEDISESGVSSSLMQQYLDPILRFAVDSDVRLRGTAFEVLFHIVKQGLVHPLQVCFLRQLA
jgi:hypothetical protein